MTEKKMAPRVAARKASKSEALFSLSSTSDDSPDATHDARARERAARNVRKYLAWKADNGRAYSMLCDVARARAEAGGVVSGDELIRWLRGHDVVNDLGLPSRPNNNYSAPLVRDICLHHPMVRPHVEMRTGVYDRLEFMLATGGEAR